MMQMADGETIKQAAFVHVRSWCYSHRDYLKQEELAKYTPESSEIFWRSKIKQPGIEVYLCFRKVQPVGMIGIDRQRAEILSLYVLPEMIGKGVGHELLQFALDSFEKGTRVFLTVINYNSCAREFYEKHGFHYTGETELHDSRRGITELVYDRII